MRNCGCDGVSRVVAMALSGTYWIARMRIFSRVGGAKARKAVLELGDGEIDMSLSRRVNAAIDAALVSRIVGCVVLIRQDGREIYARAAGLADREAGRAMKRDAIFRLASVTKPIVATAVLRMIDLGLLELDDTVTKFLPWFTPRTPDGTVPAILIRHLITHMSGITYDVPATISSGLSGIATISLEENLRRLADVPLAFEPGTGWAYGMGIDVLGGVIAAINASSLEQAVAKYVCGPLGMAGRPRGWANWKQLLTIPAALWFFRRSASSTSMRRSQEVLGWRALLTMS
jgi:CubicO group peptidase (beta-lactamase class C family)